MTEEDKQFVLRCLREGVIKSPCLELGGLWETMAQFLTPAGIEHKTTDIEPGSGVDFVADFCKDDTVREAFNGRRFNTVIALNILEHTFEPIRVLDNIVSLLNPGGSLVLTSPVVWPLHSVPRDYYRLNPHFYEDYSEKRGLRLRDDFFEYINDRPVRKYYDGEQYCFPLPSSPRRRLYSRIVHRLFNTDARGQMFSNYLILGAVIEKPL
jgi:SAM-dependent methyltransferase